MPESPTLSTKSSDSLPADALLPQRVGFQDVLTPPDTPDERLLVDDDAQFAAYRPPTTRYSSTPPINKDSLSPKRWVPFPLRTWFWLPFVLILVFGAIGLEVALYFCNKNNGWSTNQDLLNNQAGVMHYVYTLPPVAIAAVLAAIWAWTDIEIKKMQPYVALVHGDSPPQRSLLLDYTRTNNFWVWTRAMYNKHYLVTLASLMVLLTLTFQPLAAALLIVKDVRWNEPNATVNNLQQLGLNQNLQFDDLSSFLTAAGYASASVLYALPNPPFITGPYTVAEFQMPSNVVVSGTTVSANTTAMRSDAGCRAAIVDMTQNSDQSGWSNSLNEGSCSITFAVDKSARDLFGTDTVDCGDGAPEQFKPVLFWFFTYQPQAMASATLCFPSFTLWDVNVGIDLASGNITRVTELQPFSSSSSPFSSLSANITGAPLNGRAYNGIQFNLSEPDPFVLARRNATQLQMPAAVFQSAVLSDEGLVGSFQADRFVRLSTNVYRMYMTLIAKKVYFLDVSEPFQVGITTIKKRLFLTDVAVHLLAVGLLLLAFFGTLVQLLHRYDRRSLHLLHEPGTIASAVAIGAQTGMGDLLAGRQREQDINEALKDRRFRIDPRTMKIVMVGEPGYEEAHSPTEKDKVNRRRSILAALQKRGDGVERKFSWRRAKSPTSPN